MFPLVEQFNLIKKLIGEGKTCKEVQQIIGCSAKIISNALKWQQKPETRRRKWETTVKTDRRIVKMAKTQPIITSRKIKDDLKLPLSPVAVGRRLIEAKLSARSPCRAPLLKKRHAQNEFKFAKEHIDWSKEKCRNILWTDESKIVLFEFSGHRQYVRQPPGPEFKTSYTHSDTRRWNIEQINILMQNNADLIKCINALIWNLMCVMIGNTQRG